MTRQRDNNDTTTATRQRRTLASPSVSPSLPVSPCLSPPLSPFLSLSLSLSLSLPLPLPVARPATTTMARRAASPPSSLMRVSVCMHARWHVLHCDDDDASCHLPRPSSHMHTRAVGPSVGTKQRNRDRDRQRPTCSVLVGSVAYGCGPVRSEDWTFKH
ncbi:hypothetical protein OG21DRAFT_1491594 [Imleria badia]|nr:hypothetical protein OG21DRAFT_1491594 [Imleria badia]